MESQLSSPDRPSSFQDTRWRTGGHLPAQAPHSPSRQQLLPFLQLCRGGPSCPVSHMTRQDWVRATGGDLTWGLSLCCPHLVGRH